MIRNVIFDMGGVLIKFDRQYFLSRLNVSDEDRKLLFKEVYNSIEWPMMDRGTLVEEEALVRMKKNLPERLHDAAETLTLRWNDMSWSIEGMKELILELKEKGYGIYLLSNASKRIYDYWDTIEGHEYFEKMVVSCDYGYVKPQNEIYQLFNKEFGLSLNECVFIDDTSANVEGAVYNGMSGIVFNGDVKELRLKLNSLGVEVDI